MYLKTIVGLCMMGMLMPMSMPIYAFAETQSEAGSQQSAIADTPEPTVDQPSAIITETPIKEGMPLAGSAKATDSEGVDEPSNAAEEALEDKLDEEEISDPLEPVNRAIFTFNDKLYFWVLKPVSTGYSKVLPEPARVAVRNLYTNISMPMRFAGSLMQGKVVAAGTELARFAINTTLGLAGLFDVAADNFGLQAHMEDLGQTLGFYGIGNGLYLVLPVLGPSTLRDTIGLAGDAMIYPVAYIQPVEAMVGVIACDKINRTSLSLGTYDDWKNTSLDLYTSMKDAYVKRRKILIKK